MKQSKKLTRTQRTVLEKLGYNGLEDVRYQSERGDVVIFVRENGEKIEINKQLYYKMK